MIIHEPLFPFLNRILFGFKDNIELWYSFEKDFSKINIFVNNQQIFNHKELYEYVYIHLKMNKLFTKYSLSCCTHSVLSEIYIYIQNKLLKYDFVVGECENYEKMKIFITRNNDILSFDIIKVLTGYHNHDCNISFDYMCILKFSLSNELSNIYNDKIEISINKY